MDKTTLPNELILSDSLLVYKNWLMELAGERKSTPITNGGKEHAALLMGQIFRSANEYVYIYSKALSGKLTSFDYYLDALKDCVEKNIKVRVLLQEKPGADSGAYSLLMEKINIGYKNIEINILPEEKIKKIEEGMGRVNAHFAIADDCIFRLEYDPKEYKAIASFNDPNIVQVLKAAFESAS